MFNITSASGLKDAIQLLEVDQAIQKQLLEEQFYLTCESLRPINLLKGTLIESISSPHLLENILSASVGLATGYLSKKVVVGMSGNIIRKILGSLLQFGVTSAVTQHPDTIKSIGKYLFRKVFSKNEINAPKS